MHTSSEIKGYYEEFSKTVLLKDFSRVNLRLQAIRNLCDRFILPGAHVLEIGCGAGIISKHLQTRGARIISVDISETNVRIAKLYSSSPLNEFLVLDITGNTTVLDQYGKFDAMLLPDVLEHIPKEKHGNLFRRIEGLLSPKGIVLITFPSPEYQKYLKQYSPNLLQVVDETLFLPELLACTSLAPIYFSYVDCGERNQYNHLVLTVKVDYVPAATTMGLVARMIRAAKKTSWKVRNKRFLRKARSVV